MQRFWEFTPWLPYEVDDRRLVEHCRFINSEEVFSAGISPGRKRDTPFPVPQLALTLPDFSVDCFSWEAFPLVSGPLRAAMALPADDVEYFPVDASRSSAAVRAMNYMVMSVAVTDRVSYPREKREFTSQQDYLASLVHDSSVIDVSSKPRHRLFRDEQFIGSMFCTDDLAMAVLQAGCTGVRFLDPRHSDLNRPMRFRTLRGVEEEGDWDPVNKVEHTVLVETLGAS